jgi:MHS family proline/betaine transporter-like MFS transporter
MLATWLIHATGLSIAPAGLITVAALVAFLVMLWVPDGSREPLP